jgi:hypothetical protein
MWKDKNWKCGVSFAHGIGLDVFLLQERFMVVMLITVLCWELFL